MIMPATLAAGLLIWKQTKKGKTYALCHPGGPYYTHKNIGVWTIPKGLVEANEDLLQTALREANEECGFIAPTEAIYRALTVVKYQNKKTLFAWAIQISENYHWEFTSNRFSTEWPPRSGKTENFYEIDRMDFFLKDEALIKIHPVQQALILEVESFNILD